MTSTTSPLVSVIMPTFNQASFLERAVDSLREQTECRWELVLVDDGSLDTTREAIERLAPDGRIRQYRLETNRGLGAALNAGIDNAFGEYIAYLPSDDVYYADHLASLVSCLQVQREAPLAFSGIRHHYNRSAPGRIDGSWLQLVQVMHRRSRKRWTERDELVTDDLSRMYWSKLGAAEGFAGTGSVTCEWVDHPDQLHKVLQEPEGGINTYRGRFNVSEPMRFHTSVGNPIDEVEMYRRYRERPDTVMSPEGLKILLVGELAYNADRVLALEEQGHRLYGLWMPNPYWYNTVGPVPFGHVEDLPRSGWEDAIRRVHPDVIYALLNWQTVPFAWNVLKGNPGVPFVWHFKEGPFICLEKGTWSQLVDLYTEADGRIYTSPEMGAWFATVAPRVEGRPSLVLDGDLPKRDWFDGRPSPRLSLDDGELHTVVPGRPIGLTPELVGDLACRRIHLHVYGDYTLGQWRDWIARAERLASKHLHLHPVVHQDAWVSEFSKYDAGWLHFVKSDNQGEIRRANWDDMNYPARLSTLAAARLPLLQARNDGAIVATQTLARRLDIGLFFDDMEELANQLRDDQRLEYVRRQVDRNRSSFTFDAHVDELVRFFRTVIDVRSGA